MLHIDTDIPLPTPLRRSNYNIPGLREQILSCRRGDSFLIPTLDFDRVQKLALGAALSLRKQGRSNLRITTRTSSVGQTFGIRVWRVR